MVWKINEEVVGYVRHVANFTQVVVRKSGHYVPHDQPKIALQMIKNFIASKQFV